MGLGWGGSRLPSFLPSFLPPSLPHYLRRLASFGVSFVRCVFFEATTTTTANNKRGRLRACWVAERQMNGRTDGDWASRRVENGGGQRCTHGALGRNRGRGCLCERRRATRRARLFELFAACSSSHFGLHTARTREPEVAGEMRPPKRRRHGKTSEHTKRGGTQRRATNIREYRMPVFLTAHCVSCC